MASVINSFAIKGIDAYVVKIETDTIYGKPCVSIVGLGDTSIKESKERLEAAIKHNKYEFPKMKIVINLAPCDMKKSGSHFDLGMSIGILLQSNQIIFEEINNFAFIGELSLNGELRPVTGVLPMAMEAKRAGIKNIILPKGNYREAKLVGGINVLPFNNLNEVINFIQDGVKCNFEISDDEEKNETENYLDFRDVQGQDTVIDFVVAAAAGGHNLILSGPPGCGKSMIAKRIPTILPSMIEEEALEVTKIYSVAGLLKNKGSLINKRPFRSPHHNASMNSLIGGGTYAKPGEISLAHNGVLFLDEIAEFKRLTLESLRQPLEDKIISIARVKYSQCYPANFMLIAAMNPCPCGYYGDEKCHCTDYEVLKYRSKISGPVLDRIDIQKYVNSVKFKDLSTYKKGRSSRELKDIVENARKIQNERFKNCDKINSNSQMPTALIKEFCVLDNESVKLLENTYDKFNFSARSYYKFLRVARTFADLEGEINIRKHHIVKALLCRDLEKEQSKMMVV